MERISFTKGTMMFNQRVLSLGSIDPGVAYSIKELKNKMFFNKIFWDNMNELFQKYPCFDIVTDYVRSLHEYVRNIQGVLRHIDVNYPGIVIDGKDSFERNLMTETVMEGQLIAEYFPNLESVQARFKASSDIIYFVSILENDYIGISYVDPRKDIYQRVISREISGVTKYWKADDCVLSYVKSLYGNDTIMMKLTTSLNSDNISKIEYFGDEAVMQSILPLFDEETLVICNPYIYIQDIQKILESRIVSEPVQSQKFETLSWEKIFSKDILIEYPLTSFDVYLQLLRLAALDNRVKSIHLTIYRIGNDPVLYYILRDAVLNGIDVHVNIELRATGESINRFWAEELRKIGVEVTHFANGYLKVHSKITLITFNDGRKVAQVGTGNYHSQTVTQYTDLSLITSEKSTCEQVEKLFDIIRGIDDKDDFDFEFLVTQYNARGALKGLIQEQGQLGDKGYIGIKCNSLNDEDIESCLSEAASRGCRIDLIVRGVCAWVPWQYLGENVMVKSIVWDKLEHSRVYCFGYKNPDVYIGSLDPTTNKLDGRIETLVHVQDPGVLKQVCNYLNSYIVNTRNSWLMESRGVNDVVYVRE